LHSTVRDTFDEVASEYDELKLRFIPGYRQVQEMALRYAESGGAARVLELGCGTGEWAAKFFQKHPGAEYSAIEFSENMRELAAARLAAHGDRVRLIDQDLNSPLPKGAFDLVVSFFAIHHVEDKERLFREVFDRLCPGGRLIFADITVAADPDLERAFLDGWIAFMRESGLEEERIAGVLEDHRQNDLPEPSAQLLRYLQTAGFALAEVIWSLEKFVVFFAGKRETPA
jgi:tRNA (cmo5U34)-methyltransferase